MNKKMGAMCALTMPLVLSWGCSDAVEIVSGGDAGGADAAAEARSPDGSSPDTGQQTEDGGPASNADAQAPDGEVPDSGGPRHPLLLAAGTDYVSTEVAALDVDAGSVVNRITVSDGDAVPAGSGGIGFVIERTNGVVHVLDAMGAIEHTVTLPSGDSGAALNPHDVVVVKKNGSAKAYVSLYDANAIAVVDVGAGSVESVIDLGSLLASGDTDGSVDVDAGHYDPATDRVYFAAQRIDLTTITMATDYIPLCPEAPSVLIAIDPNTDSLVDMNGDAAGQGVELSLVAPADLSWDAAGNRLLLVHNGCTEPGDAGSARVRHGIEAVSLSTGESSVLYSPTSADFLNRLIAVSSGSFVVESFDASYSTNHHVWETSASALGALLVGAPSGLLGDSESSLIGVVMTPNEGGSRPDLARYLIASQDVLSVIEGLWESGVGNLAGLAWVEP